MLKHKLELIIRSDISLYSNIHECITSLSVLIMISDQSVIIPIECFNPCRIWPQCRYKVHSLFYVNTKQFELLTSDSSAYEAIKTCLYAYIHLYLLAYACILFVMDLHTQFPLFCLCPAVIINLQFYNDANPRYGDILVNTRTASKVDGWYCW